MGRIKISNKTANQTWKKSIKRAPIQSRHNSYFQSISRFSNFATHKKIAPAKFSSSSLAVTLRSPFPTVPYNTILPQQKRFISPNKKKSHMQRLGRSRRWDVRSLTTAPPFSTLLDSFYGFFPQLGPFRISRNSNRRYYWQAELKEVALLVPDGEGKDDHL